MDSIEHVLQQVDLDIRQGRETKAKADLIRLLEMPLKGLNLEKCAALLRRLGLHQQSLRILRPAVIGSGRKLPVSSPMAKIEYGAALIQMDMVEAGRRFLTLEETRVHPEARRWFALSFLHDFQMERAALEISKVIPQFPAGSYDQLILKVNFLVATLGELSKESSYFRFRELVQEVAQEIKTHQAYRLASALDSLVTQAVFFANSDEELRLEQGAPVTYLDFFKHFVSVFHEGRAGRVSRLKVKMKYQQLRKIAVQNSWFEALREIDFHYFRIFQPNHLGLIKMGTRHRHYQSQYLDTVSIPTIYCFPRREVTPKKINLTLSFKLQSLPAASLLRQLFQLLYQEQYSFLSPYVIWSVLMKGEHFIEPHAQNCIHQWIRRLKKWLKAEGVPARIVTGKLGYSLQPEASLQCSSGLLYSNDVEVDLLRRMQNTFSKDEFFKLSDVKALAPGVSTRELQYRLKTFLDQGSLERLGRARAIQYRLRGV